MSALINDLWELISLAPVLYKQQPLNVVSSGARHGIMSNTLTLHAQFMSFLANTIIDTLAHSLTQTVKSEHACSLQSGPGYFDIFSPFKYFLFWQQD